MKISHLNSLSFKSTPLYNVKLKQGQADGTYKELPATFSKLSKTSKEDIKTIEKLSYSWGKTRYGEKITSNFLGYGPVCNEDDEFYVIEGYEKPGKKTIYSIAEVNQTDRSVSYIQANPKNKDREIKGSGELILYGLGKKLGQNRYGEYYSLCSAFSAMGFYRQAGLLYESQEFSLNEENAPQFFDRIEKKYNFNFESKEGKK